MLTYCQRSTLKDEIINEGRQDELNLFEKLVIKMFSVLLQSAINCFLKYII